MSLNKINLQPYECGGDSLGCLPRIHFSLHPWLFLGIHTFSVCFSISKKANWTPSSRSETDWARVSLLIGSGIVRLQLGPMRPKRCVLILLQKWLFTKAYSVFLPLDEVWYRWSSQKYHSHLPATLTLKLLQREELKENHSNPFHILSQFELT